MIFPMTLDRANRTLTTLILAVAAAATIVSVLATPERGRPTGILIAFAVTVGLAIVWALSPKGIEIEGDQLKVLRRAAPPLRFTADEIVSVEEGSRPSSARTVRVFGSGGLFGSYGLFWTSGFGRYKLYATRSGPTLVLRRRTGLPMVLTPDDPRGAREAIAAFAARSA